MQRKWRRRWGRTAAALLLTAAAADVAYAMPQGGEVTTGNATVTQSGHTMTVNQTTDKVAMNWQSFSVAANEQVNYVQPSKSAVALNRVVGTDASTVYGKITANGKVFLVNPNGILFSPGSQVDVGGLVASTLNITDENLAKGNYTFSSDAKSGKVVNQGTIQAQTGGYVALMAPEVRNEGVIVAKQGTVALTAGNKITVDFAGDGKLNFAIDQKALNALASNKGVIQADGGVVIMAARSASDLVSTVVNNGGVIQAKSVSSQNGTIVLDGGTDGVVVNSGSLDASGQNSGETGGTVKVLGDKVALEGSASVDVSGDAGGGKAIIGGNFNGAGPEANADAVYIGKDVNIKADALHSGDGGEVAVWANSATRFYGTISACGGTNSGDGGKVETSGKYLDAQGTVALGAANGKGGQWLLDPYNITIQNTGSDTNISGDPDFTATGDSSILTVASILATLDAGGSVTVNTDVSGGTQAGDILVNSDISTTGGGTNTATLTLNAARDVIINGAVTSTGGSLNFIINPDYDRNGSGAAVVYKNISTNGGYVTFGSDSSYTVGTYLGGAGTRTISTNGGAITFYGDLLLGAAGGVVLDTSSVTGGGNITFSGGINSGNSYQYVAGSYTWDDAKTAAQGITGGGSAVGDTYLATVTSSLENSLVTSAADGNESWIGAQASGNVPNRVWRWKTGPEGQQDGGNGLAFFNQTSNAATGGGSGNAINGQYSAWNAGEPNQSDNTEDSAIVGWSTQALWNDYTGGSHTLGYIKETNLANTALTIKAGTGNIVFDGAVGANKQLASLTIQSANNVTANGTININGATTFGSVTAINNLLLNQAVTTTGGGTITANAGSYIKIAGDVSADGALHLTGPVIEIDTGNITADQGFIATGNTSITSSSLAITSDDSAVTFNGLLNADSTPAALAINAGTGTVTFGAAVGGVNNLGDLTVSGGQIVTASGINITAEDITFNAPVVAAGNTKLTAKNDGDITINSSFTDASGTVTFAADHNIILNSGASIQTSGSSVTLTANADGQADGGDINLSGATITTNGGSIALGGGAVYLNGTLLQTTNTVTINAGTGAGSGAVVLGTVSAGNLIINTAGAASQTGTINAAGLTLNGGGTYTFNSNNDIDTLTGNVAGVSFTDTDGFVVSGLTASGNIILNTPGTVTQTGAITASGLTLNGGGTYTLTGSNDVDSLAGNLASVSFTDTDGFAVSGLAASGNIILNTPGAVSQTGAITAGALTLNGGGTYTLTGNNDVDSLTGNIAGLSFTDTDGFSVSGLITTGNVVLNTPAVVTQTGVIIAAGLTLNGGGTYILTGTNDVDTLAGNVGSVSFADNDGFSIGAISASGSITLSTPGPVTQSGTITAVGLTLNGGGSYTLNGSNDVDTLAGNVASLSFTDTDGFAVTGLTTGGNVVFTTPGTVTQSAAITASGLTLNGGTFILNNSSNNITALSGNVSDLSFTDTDGFAVGGITATGNILLNTSGFVTQSGAITASGLTLNGGGMYTLNNSGNDVDTLAGNASTLSFADTDGFTVSGLTAGNILFNTPGTVLQSGAITANGFTLNGAGTYTLNDNNDVDTLAGNVTALSFTDTDGFAVLGLTASGGILLNTPGAVTELGSIAAGGLTLNGNGTYILTGNNDVDTLAGNVTALSFIDTDGFAVSGLTATGNIVLSTPGSVTQSGSIAAAGLTLNGAGTYTLNDTNDIDTLAGNVALLSFTDTNGFTVSGLTATGNIVLSTPGSVTQSGSITAGGLTLNGGGIFTLTGINDVDTLSGNTATLSFNDADGFAVAGLAATGNIVLTTPGVVTQTGALTATGLTLNGGGTYTLNHNGNDVDVLTGNAAVLSFSDVDGFNTTGLTATGTIVLSTPGTVTQTGVITAAILTLNGGGTFNLNASNQINYLSGNVGNVSFTDPDGFVVSGLTSTGNISLSTPGTVTQTGAITAVGLTLNGGGSYTLNNGSNDAASLSGNVSALSYTDTNGFDVFGLTATGNITLNTPGTVTQTGAITASGLALNGGGSYTLNNSNNDVDNLTGNVTTLSFADTDGFNTTGLTASGNITLNTPGTVTQTGAITAGGLALNGSGTYTLTGSNDVDTLSGNVNALSFTDTDGFAVSGLAATGNVTLSTPGTVTQTGAITASGLALNGSGSYTLTGSNDVDTLSGNVTTLSFTDTDGFNTTGLTASGNITLNTPGTVTQTGAITAGGLALNGGGTYTLNSNNDVATLSGNVAALSYTDTNSFAVSGLAATGNVTLNTPGTVTQTGVITASGLALNGGGSYTLTGNNDVDILSGNVAALSFTDTDGFNTTGLTASGNITLNTPGTVTQTGAITASGLALNGGGSYTLNNSSNDVDTLSGNVAALSFTDTDGFAVSGLAATGNVTLSTPGTVTQTGAITASGLALNGGSYTLNSGSNNVDTLFGNVAALSYTDTNGFAVSGLTATGNVTLSTPGTVTQTGAITASGLSLNGDGSYTLNNSSNDIDSLSGNVTTLSFTDTDGFVVSGLTATGNVTLNTPGTVTQTGAITASGLALNGGGSYTLNNSSNDIDSLSGNVTTLSFTDTNGFAVSGLTATGNVTLNTPGTVTQTGAITASGLSLNGGGSYTLNNSSNDIDSLSGNVTTLSFTDTDGFVVSGLTATGNVTLNTPGTVTQTGAITASGLALNGGGSYTLNNSSNDIDSLSGNVTTLSFTDTNGFAVSGLTATGNVTLNTPGTVTQTGAITASGLALNGGGTYTLNSNNDVVTLSGNVAALSYTDTNGFAVSGLTATGNITLNTSGTVTQTGVITASGLALNGGGTYTLNSNNDVATLSGNVAALSYTDTNSFAVSGLTATGNVTLNTPGTVTQTGVITASGLALNGGGSYTLTGNNDVDILSGNVAALSFTDTDGFNTTGLTASGNITLNTPGTVTQTGAITASGLALNGGGSYTLNNSSNDVDTLSGNVAALSFTDTDGFAVSGLTATGNVTLSTPGTVTQTGAITASALALNGSGSYTLNNSSNDVDNLSGNVTTLSFTDTDGFNTTGLAANGDIVLSTPGTVTQTGAITASGLALNGSGSYTLNNSSNDVDNLSGNVTTLSFTDTDDFNTTGLAANGDIVLSTPGAVTQTGAITADGLTLNGGGSYTLNNSGNDVDTLSANVDTLTFTDTDGFNTTGLAANGDIVLSTPGAVTQTGAITADGLTLNGGGSYTLNNSGNDVDTLSANVDTLTFTDTDGFNTTGLAANGDIVLSTPGAVTQTGAITADGLALNGGGSYTLNNSSNDVDTLSANVEDLTFTDTDGFNTTGLAANGDIVLSTPGAVTQTGAITADGLALNGGGNYTLNNSSNDVDTLSANVEDLTFTDTDGFNTTGLAANGDIVLSTPGAVTQTGAITADGLALNGGGNYTLNNSSNDVDTLSANVEDLTFTDTDGFNTTGLAANGDIVLSTPGAVTQTGAITATGLALNGDGTYTLNSNNDVDNLSGTVDDLSFTDSDGFNTTGLAANGDIVLSTPGAVTQTGAITADGLALNGGGSYTLNNSGNDINVLAGDAGSVSYSQGNSLTIGEVDSTIGLTADHTVFVRTTGNSADITLADAVSAGATGDSIILAAGRNFINHAGSTPLDPGQGRFLVYSTSPAANYLGEFSSPGNAFGRTYDANPPGSTLINSLSGSRMIYAVTPTITVTADSQVKIYGEAVPNLNYTVSGLIDGDTATSSLAGELSTPATAGSNVGIYDINQNTLSSPLGYNINYVGATLTINPAVLTYVADQKSMIIGDPAPALTGTVTGFVNGDTLASATTGTLSFETTADWKSLLGQYPIDGQGLAANHGNYILVQAAGNATAMTVRSDLIDNSRVTAVEEALRGNGANPAAGTPDIKPDNPVIDVQALEQTTSPTSQNGFNDNNQLQNSTAAGRKNVFITVTDDSGAVSRYKFTETETVTSIAFADNFGLSLPDGEAEVVVFQVGGGQVKEAGTYTASVNGNGLSLVNTSTANKPSGEPHAAKGTYTQLNWGDGTEGSYFVGFNGISLLVYPLDYDARTQVASTNSNGNKKIVAASIMAALKDLDITPAQIQAVNIYMD